VLVSLVIFGAVLGIRIGPWPVDEPVADQPVDIVRPPLPVRFRDPAAAEAVIPTLRPSARIVHHTTARHAPPQHLSHHS
jgi:hypothetical protein